MNRLLSLTDIRRAILGLDQIATRFPAQPQFWFFDLDLPGKLQTADTTTDIEEFSNRLLDLEMPHLLKTSRSGGAHVIGRLSSPDSPTAIDTVLRRILRDQFDAVLRFNPFTWKSLHIETRFGMQCGTEFLLTSNRQFFVPHLGQRLLNNSPVGALAVWSAFQALPEVSLDRLERHLIRPRRRPFLSNQEIDETASDLSSSSVPHTKDKGKNRTSKSTCFPQSPPLSPIPLVNTSGATEPAGPDAIRKVLESVSPGPGRRDGAIAQVCFDLVRLGLCEQEIARLMEPWLLRGDSGAVKADAEAAIADLKRQIRNICQRRFGSAVRRSRDPVLRIMTCWRTMGRKVGDTVPLTGGFIASITGIPKSNHRKIPKIRRRLVEEGFIEVVAAGHTGRGSLVRILSFEPVRSTKGQNEPNS